MKRVLVTGAGGFLGTAILHRLCKEDTCELVAVTGSTETVRKQYGDRVKAVPRNFLFSEAFRTGSFDFVIHCAFPRNTSGNAFAEGMRYTADAFEAFRRADIRSVINISSQSVYDEKRTSPATEDSLLCLNSAYAVGKYTTELLLEHICPDIPHTNVRMASLIGPGFEQRIVNRFVRQALDDNVIRVSDNGQRFGFLDVEDAVSGLVLMLNSSTAVWRKVYNLGNASQYSLLEIACEVRNVLAEMNGIEIALQISKDETYSNTSVNADAFYREFGTFPGHSLKASIERICESYGEGI